MANILDYLDWRGDLSFASSPFNDVDSVILSQLAYIEFSDVTDGGGITLNEAAKALLVKYPDGVIPKGLMRAKEMNTLLIKASVSKRFRNAVVFMPQSLIDTEKNEQFAAMTFILGDGNMYVAFRGTDQSVVGWKEDFNMSFISPVPSQPDSVTYLESVASLRGENIFTGGHSKGGNLAMYSAAFSRGVSDRILRIYNNDGPGFPESVVSCEEFDAILPKIISIVPQGSVVGMLLEHREVYSIVKSSQRGLLQHDCFSWEVMGRELVTLPSRNSESKLVDSTLSEWLTAMTDEERGTFVNALCEVLTATEAQTLSALSSDGIKLIKSIRGLDQHTKEVLNKALRELREQAKRSAKEFASGLIQRTE